MPSKFLLQLAGRQLPSMDWLSGSSDPYYIVYLVTQNSRRKIFTSNTVYASLNPEWDKHTL